MSSDYTVSVLHARINSFDLAELSRTMTDLMNRGFEIERTMLKDGMLVVIMVRGMRRMTPEETKRAIDMAMMFHEKPK